MTRPARSSAFPLAFAFSLAFAFAFPFATAHADDPLTRLPREPSVSQLQHAAARYAEVDPARVRSWLRRVRTAAALPGTKVRVGHGNYGILYGVDGLARPPTNEQSWRVEVELDWQLDRLVFDREEVGLARESQRLAARRELIQTEVAQLYFARRRLQLEALQPGDPETQAERQLAIDELTAVLDGLTDGALTRGGTR